MPSQALQIIFEIAKPKEQPKKSSKENTFFQIAKCAFFFIFLKNVIDAQRGRLHLLFGHHKQCYPTLSVS